MNVVCLQIFVTEVGRHHGKLTYEWLLDTAQELGIKGGSAFLALAGFGRHGQRDAEFLELAGEQSVVVECFVKPGMTDALLGRVAEADLSLPYAKLQAELGITEK